MLNVDSLNEGVVIDHIKAGSSMDLYKYLNLDELDCSVAIIKNARSGHYGKKDIIKIEGNLDLNLDILGFIDPNITVNIGASPPLKRESSRFSSFPTRNVTAIAVRTASRNSAASMDKRFLEEHLSHCTLCPRKCGVNRLNGETGFCGASDAVRVARAALHFWEEPCLSGEAGSGTVFFSFCTLKCVFCQNYEISTCRRVRIFPG